MIKYVLSILFYLPVAATYYVHPVAGLAVSTGYLVYHFWTHRIQNEVHRKSTDLDIDSLIMSSDPMDLVKEDRERH